MEPGPFPDPAAAVRGLAVRALGAGAVAGAVACAPDVAVFTVASGVP